MKTYSKFTKMVGKLFVLSLVLTSCGYTNYTIGYHPYAIFPRFVNLATHGGGEIRLSVQSNWLDSQSIEAEVTFTDTKTSELVAPNGQVIKPGETFKISGINETHVYKFNSGDTSLHAVEFRFKNTDGLNNFVQKADVWVKGHYEFTTTAPAVNSVEVNKPIKIDYVYRAFDPTPQTCEIRFEAPTDADAAINGKKQADGAQKVVDTGGSPALPLVGTFEYTPSAAGTHTVTVTAKNEFGFEKKAAFTVVATP